MIFSLASAGAAPVSARKGLPVDGRIYNAPLRDGLFPRKQQPAHITPFSLLAASPPRTVKTQPGVRLHPFTIAILLFLFLTPARKARPHRWAFRVSAASPLGLRPQARVEAQPPEAALSAETEAAARRRLMRGSLAIRPVHGLPRHTRPSSVASRHLPPQGKAFTGGSYETHRTGHSQFC